MWEDELCLGGRGPPAAGDRPRLGGVPIWELEPEDGCLLLGPQRRGLTLRGPHSRQEGVERRQGQKGDRDGSERKK